MTESGYSLRRAGIGVALALLLSGCMLSKSDTTPHAEVETFGWSGSTSVGASPQAIKAGQAVAARHCAGCHAIDRISSSPLPGAPPLREVLALYEDVDALGYRFIEGMRVGHDEMPVFDLDIPSADALIAYLQSIQD